MQKSRLTNGLTNLSLHVAKGQLISKAIYGVLDSPKNERKRFDLICHSSIKPKFFNFLLVFWSS